MLMYEQEFISCPKSKINCLKMFDISNSGLVSFYLQYKTIFQPILQSKFLWEDCSLKQLFLFVVKYSNISLGLDKYIYAALLVFLLDMDLGFYRSLSSLA